MQRQPRVERSEGGDVDAAQRGGRNTGRPTQEGPPLARLLTMDELPKIARGASQDSPRRR
jgi:hypothetical protein